MAKLMKSYTMDADVCDMLRDYSFESRRSQSEIICTAAREYLEPLMNKRVEEQPDELETSNRKLDELAEEINKARVQKREEKDREEYAKSLKKIGCSLEETTDLLKQYDERIKAAKEAAVNDPTQTGSTPTPHD